MRPVNLTIIPPGTDATVSHTTQRLDASERYCASFAVYLAGTTTPSITAYVEGNNTPPPPGAILTDWVPPEASWFQAYDGSAITTVMAADGTYPLAVGPAGLLFRWIRLRLVVGTPGGGTVSVDYFARGNA